MKAEMDYISILFSSYFYRVWIVIKCFLILVSIFACIMGEHIILNQPNVIPGAPLSKKYILLLGVLYYLSLVSHLSWKTLSTHYSLPVNFSRVRTLFSFIVLPNTHRLYFHLMPVLHYFRDHSLSAINISNIIAKQQ